MYDYDRDFVLQGNYVPTVVLFMIIRIINSFDFISVAFMNK